MQILITGATGFIGSTLAARFLHRGDRVTCLARGHDGPTRTRAKIEAAASGLGIPVSPDSVRVLPYDIAKLGADELSGIDALWHCAASMTFSSRKVREAIDVNVGGTRALYEVLAAYSPNAHFFYVSTAYTGGVEADQIDEVLHLSPHLVNPYFVSKWAAELVLEKLSRSADGPAVTVYRPTIVVGHTQTGWYGGQSFGLYNFLDGVSAARLAGGTGLRLDISPATEHNYVPIDDLAHNAVALTERRDRLDRFSTLIEDGTYNTNADRVAWIAEGMNVGITFGKPRTLADHVLDLWVAINKPFNQPEAGKRPFSFCSGKIRGILGADHRHTVLDHELHLRMIRWYDEHRLTPLERKAQAEMGVRAARWAGFVAPRQAAGVLAKSAYKAHQESGKAQTEA
jgi:nucleoside-diphosphate-sugar epimerase